MKFRSFVRQSLRHMGVDVRRYRPGTPASSELPLAQYGVDTVFDIGANIGMSAQEFRRNGFRGQIVSFEPVQHLYAELEKQSQIDDKWQVEQLALGAQLGNAEIFVTGGHSGASSLLEMTGVVIDNAPDQAVVRTETVQVSTVDEVVAKYYPSGDRLFLKIDVQGFEKLVLEGARATLPRVVGLKLEASLIETYRGGSLLIELLPWLYELGFRVVSIERGFDNRRTWELFQVDIACFRVERALS